MIDPIFNMFKIKHLTLDSLKVLDPKVNRVHIYINLESVFNKLINPRVNNYLMANVKGDLDKNKIKLAIVSHVINLAQHYRLYCAKHKKESRIILYWNYPVSTEYVNRKYIIDYRAYYNHKMFRNEECKFLVDCIQDAFHILQQMVQFVNEVYLVNGGTIESSMIPIVMEQHVYQDYTNHTQKIIISDSKYDFQYTTQPEFTVIESARDKSIIVNQNNVIELLKNRMGIKSLLSVPNTLIPFVISLLGDRYRNIPKLAGVGMSTILKMANLAIQNNIITESTKDVDMLSEIITESYRQQFRNNYLCTSLEYQQRDVTPYMISAIRQQIIDKFDDRTLKNMNEKYFLHCPIMLIETKTNQVMGTYADSSSSIWETKKR